MISVIIKAGWLAASMKETRQSAFLYLRHCSAMSTSQKEREREREREEEKKRERERERERERKSSIIKVELA